MPAFKGYRGFPGSICASPNAMVVHGIPGRYKLERGDILSVDVGVVLDGWVADAARTFPVGPVTPVAQKLLDDDRGRAVRRRCRSARRAIAWATSRTRSSSTSRREGFSIIRSLVGHGIGREMHEDPQIPNYGPPGRGPRLEEGMVLAIEPMVTAGRHQVRMADDHWSIFTQDGSLAAHFEFTIAITADGPARAHAMARARPPRRRRRRARERGVRPDGCAALATLLATLPRRARSRPAPRCA